MRNVVFMAVALLLAVCFADGQASCGGGMAAQDVFGIALDEPFPESRKPQSTNGMVKVEAQGRAIWLKCFGPFRPYSVQERGDFKREDLMGKLLVGRVEGRTRPLSSAEALKLFEATCRRFDEMHGIGRGGRYDFEKWGKYSASWVGVQENGVPFIIELDCNDAVSGTKPHPALLSVSEFEQFRNMFRMPDVKCFGFELGVDVSEVSGYEGTVVRAETNRIDVAFAPGRNERWRPTSIRVFNGKVISVEGFPEAECELFDTVEEAQRDIIRHALRSVSPLLAERFTGVARGHSVCVDYMARNGHLCRLRMKPCRIIKKGGPDEFVAAPCVRIRFEDLTPEREMIVSHDRVKRLMRAQEEDVGRCCVSLAQNSTPDGQ